jgi:uncharacterized protein (DUF433 family)
MATAPKLEYGHITHDPEVRGGKACIGGTRIAVVDVVILHKRGYRPKEMLDHYARPLTLGQVHSALAYYYDHRDEIEAYFVDSQQAAAQLEAERAEYLSRQPVHQESIDRALPGVSADRRAGLKVAVQVADSPEFQPSEMAFRHAMRGAGEAPEKARSDANAFIRSEIEQAQYYEKLGAGAEAMAHLGLAMHTLQDFASPAHEGFQEWRTEWNSYGSREAQKHGMKERSPNAEQRKRLDSATRDTWEYFTEKKKMPADFFGGSK